MTPQIVQILIGLGVERWVTGDMIGPGERFTGRLADERVYTTAKDASWWAEAYARGAGTYEGQ